jgi:hypothetical protein
MLLMAVCGTCPVPAVTVMLLMAVCFVENYGLNFTLSILKLVAVNWGLFNN